MPQLPFGAMREPALAFWLAATSRVRQQYSDDFAGSFECHWQTKFGTAAPNDDTHYSIFCSLGDFNTNITDLLTDDRFDNLTYHTDNGEILFRYYSRIFLIVSEILTDFQDMLIVFDHSDITARGDRAENTAARSRLSPPNDPDAIQRIFSFINTIFKHKTRNIHSCNHHMKIYFQDSGDPMPTADVITTQNVEAVLKGVREGTIGKVPENVVIPSLVQVLGLVIEGYNRINQIFQAHPAKFQAFCRIYEGKSANTPPTGPVVANSGTP